MNSPVAKMIRLYEEEGYTIRTGLNPYHFSGDREAPFAILFHEEKVVSPCGGISLQEVYFFEQLFASWSPRTILIIGNGFGWSSLLLSLLNPQAQVVVLDAAVELDVPQHPYIDGIALTNKIAVKEKLNLRVVKGFSPQAVPSVVEKYLNGSVDFAFIDGLHTEAQQALDFEAIFPYAAPETVFIFHDVINWEMEAGFKRLLSDIPPPPINASSRTHWNAVLLHRTPSGMGMIYSDEAREKVADVLTVFCESPKHVAVFKAETAHQEGMERLTYRLSYYARRLVWHLHHSDGATLWRLLRRYLPFGKK